MSSVIHQLHITGMTCGGCSSRLKGVLENNPEVLAADVSHSTDSGTIRTTQNISAQEVMTLIENAGFSASQ
ncbi:MAG: copper resistance protein CopZ [Euryarchaeota archaeon]|jgi:copper chaperone CopZ|nr:copper resistance protein CopZ [Euryarchaeota archaeon]|tara:strand:+ start:395 stop:607 length:213 start_codon:yes stop_codon:yes gene_type:complete